MENIKNIPVLRFPGFNEKWRTYRLSEVSDKIQDGTHFSPIINEEKDFKYITSKNIRPGQLDLTNVDYISSSEHHKIFTRCDVKYGDVLLTKDGASTGNVCINTLKEEFSLLSSVAFIRANKKDAISDFIYQIISGPKGQKEIQKSISGQAITRITLNKLRSFRFSFPKLPEQQKIASFFSVIDDKIKALKRKKDLLEEYKKGIAQKLFSQEIRFKDENGNDFPEWKERTLDEVLTEHKLKSTGKEEVYSVSVHKGLINQIEHLGRSFAASNTDNYNIVQPNDIVYTKSPTGDFPLGIIKQSKINKNVIVSPLYGVFTPESKGLGYLLDAHFESPVNTANYLGSLIQKGAKNTINITNTTFLSKKMRLPISIEEQNKIGEFLFAIDQKIKLVEQQLSDTENWKKGLLQKMFC